MKAILVRRFGGPEVLETAERPDPEVSPGHVLVRIEAAGVNPVETYIRSGTYTSEPSLPYTPGTDGAGIVEAVGADVAGLATGDRVYTSGSMSGTYAALALCKPSQVHPLPSHLGFPEGAALGVPYGAAYRAVVQRGAARAGETVLIHGASGSVGTAAIQIARLLGLRVLGTAGSEEGLARILDEGAHLAFNHKTEGYADRIREAAGKSGIDLIVEMLANVNLPKDLELVGDRGRIVVVGTHGPVEIDPRRTLVRESRIIGMSLPHASAPEQRGIYAGIGAGLLARALRPRVGKELPLEEAAEAHRLVAAGGSGKVILRP